MFELLLNFINFFLHLDKYLGIAIQAYGVYVYLILFLIIFMETGFVVTPILPGDSMIFAAGTFAALGSLNPIIIFVLLSIAAIAGDTVNYWIGHFVGPKVFSRKNRFLKKEYLIKTKNFYQEHGGKTIIIARFIPIIRTFAPFVAGIGKMDYKKFFVYNVFGGIFWVALFTFGGYFFGELSFVKNNFSAVIMAIIIISILPAIIEYIKEKMKKT